LLFEKEKEDMEEKKKNFNIRAKKVISLLEKATRNIYRSKKNGEQRKFD
jgi:recombination DNA repair RAD52 pathway protein